MIPRFIGPSDDALARHNGSAIVRYGGFVVELTGALDAMQAVNAIPARILLAQKRAIGTLQRKIGTEARRDITAEYNLRAGRVTAGLVVKPTSDGIALIGKSRGINAIEYGATWSRVRGGGLVATTSRLKYAVLRAGKMRGDTGLGAKWSAHRGAPKKVHEDTFIGRGKNGATLVFERLPGQYYKPVAGWKAGSSSKRIEKIRGVYGLSVAQMLKHGRRPERLVDRAIQILRSEQARLLGGS